MQQQPGLSVDATVQWPVLQQLQVAGWPATLAVDGGVQVLLDGKLHAAVGNARRGNGEGRHLVLDVLDANAGPLVCGTQFEMRWRSVEMLNDVLHST